jgi:hypothetical protein
MYPICWHGPSIKVQGVFITHFREEVIVVVALDNLLSLKLARDRLVLILHCLFGRPSHRHSKVVFAIILGRFCLSVAHNGSIPSSRLSSLIVV